MEKVKCALICSKGANCKTVQFEIAFFRGKKCLYLIISMILHILHKLRGFYITLNKSRARITLRTHFYIFIFNLFY